MGSEGWHSSKVVMSREGDVRRWEVEDVEKGKKEKVRR